MNKKNLENLKEIIKQLNAVIGNAKLVPNPFNISDTNVYCISIDNLHDLLEIKQHLEKIK